MNNNIQSNMSIFPVMNEISKAHEITNLLMSDVYSIFDYIGFKLFTSIKGNRLILLILLMF